MAILRLLGVCASAALRALAGDAPRGEEAAADAAEADYQDAGEVGLQEIQIKKPMIIRNPAERPRDVVSHDSRKT